MTTHIRIQVEDFDVNDELDALAREGRDVGAVASFIGIVRGDSELGALTLEHYPGMTEREIARSVDEARARWPLDGISVIHRIGRLTVGERIVLVAVASRHRAAALEACNFLIDYLKTRAPFWKEEERGPARSWIESRKSDDEAAERWRRK
jgi:molybdopterin synthase catalytic subunit